MVPYFCHHFTMSYIEDKPLFFFFFFKSHCSFNICYLKFRQKGGALERQLKATPPEARHPQDGSDHPDGGGSGALRPAGHRRDDDYMEAGCGLQRPVLAGHHHRAGPPGEGYGQGCAFELGTFRWDAAKGN